ncbi:MAG: lipid-A-disaccharide synthase [Pseudomonadota bacterium]
MPVDSLKIVIVAGEPSGDNLGAGLIAAIKASAPNTEFLGVGGDKMEAAGCRLLYRMERIGVMGVDGLFVKLPDILKIRRDLVSVCQRERPDAFIGIDVPDFNIGLELRLKRQGIACIHYVSPTVWAWRGYRIHKIKRAVDLMLTLFPFEEKFYKKHDVPVKFVGHPIADELDHFDPDPFRQQHKLVGKPLVALLPGSRRQEVNRLTELLIESARALLKRFPESRFVLPIANARVREAFYKHAGDLSGLPLTITEGGAREAMHLSDIAVLASGTAALEAALVGCPHVVVYKVSRLSEILMKPLKHVEHYSMTNHLLEQPKIPELVQSDATADKVVAAVINLLEDKHGLEDLKRQFQAIRSQLKRDASYTAASAVLAMVAAGSQS